MVVEVVEEEVVLVEVVLVEVVEEVVVVVLLLLLCAEHCCSGKPQQPTAPSSSNPLPALCTAPITQPRWSCGYRISISIRSHTHREGRLCVIISAMCVLNNAAK